MPIILRDEGLEKHIQSPQWNFMMKYCIAFSAAAVAETVTYPLDLTKTRMQIAGELQKRAESQKKRLRPPEGMFKTAAGVIKNEGFLKLWSGILPALYRHVIYSGFRMALYEKLRNDVFGREADGSFPVYKAALCGLLVGGTAQFIASPMDLVKVQLQMEGRRQLEGKPPRVRGPFEALYKIYKKGGIRGMWKGCVPNVQRGALVNLGDLTTYDSAKRLIINNSNLEDGTGVHILASLMAGLTAALMGTPADVVKTRVMNQPTNADGTGMYYKSSLDCLQKTVKNEGFFALYKGFIPIWMRLGPWSLTFWVTFEWIRDAFGVASF